jgi:LacI family transcriptional regulator
MEDRRTEDRRTEDRRTEDQAHPTVHGAAPNASSSSESLATESPDIGSPATEGEAKDSEAAGRPAGDVNIYDVAERAGVSVATVSRATGSKGTVSDRSRQRVLRAVRELGYRPDRSAQTLAREEDAPRTLAVALPTFTTPFHNELLKGIRSRLKSLRQAGGRPGGSGSDASRPGRTSPDLLLCDLRWEEPGASLEAFLRRGLMDGLLVAGLLPEEQNLSPALLARLQGQDMPTISLGAPIEGLDSFFWREEAGARLGTEHLLERGHRRIGLITTHHENPVRAQRAAGYRNALRVAGVAPRETWVASGETDKHDGFSEESGQEAARTLLENASVGEPGGITAVFATSDVQAIGAWQVFQERGLDVPEDVALVGYDDVKVSRYIGLTSVSQQMQTVGRQATDLLLGRLRRSGPRGARPVEIMSELIQRRSTRAPIS